MTLVVWIVGSICSFLLLSYVEYRYCKSCKRDVEKKFLVVFFLVSCLTGPFAFLFLSFLLLISFFLMKVDK